MTDEENVRESARINEALAPPINEADWPEGTFKPVAAIVYPNDGVSFEPFTLDLG